MTCRPGLQPRRRAGTGLAFPGDISCVTLVPAEGGRMRLTRLVPIMVITGVAALVFTVAARAQTTDPYVGTWTLDIAKSTYKPGPAPKSTTVVVEAAGKGLKVSVDA